jgi:hypothetical protein
MFLKDIGNELLGHSYVNLEQCNMNPLALFMQRQWICGVSISCH